MNFSSKMEAKDPLEDVLNKTLTFEVWRDPKMETESYKKALKVELRQKSEKSSKICAKRLPKETPKTRKNCELVGYDADQVG